ncbi:hypothetical protein [Nitrobacter sp.]|uniref:hypothetical protein n=1 Tax=Nitrobacter sp. TaxID=29420 RepID=UPI0029CAAE52|nr:hypothetical protein [Nitrobacter sp.]
MTSKENHAIEASLQILQARISDLKGEIFDLLHLLPPARRELWYATLPEEERAAIKLFYERQLSARS